MPLRLILAAALFALLAACGSAPRKPVATASAPAAPAAGKGGGYYQNDGPPAEVAVDLAALPDAEPRAEPPHRYANRPYTALGRSYTPVTGDQPLKQRGHASWYGRQFHGNRTASGEIYDMLGMSAAHPTMELPSYARVTNLANGRSVIVRVNDRGPFLADRIIDLSYAAAVKLGYAGRGTAEVEVERITMSQIAAGTWRRGEPTLAAAAPLMPAPAETLPAGAPQLASIDPLPPVPQTQAALPALAPAAAAGGRWSVQLGVFSQLANAQALAAHADVVLAVVAADLPEAARTPRVEREGERYRVLVGTLPDRASARDWAQRMTQILAREAVAVAQ
jgi:rare lipoprotein A